MVSEGVRFNESLAKHTTFRIGGPAALFAEPHSLQMLRFLLKESSAEGIPVRVIGRGSNILVSDGGVKALVIKLSAPCFMQVRFRADLVEAGAGVPVQRLMHLARGRSLGGLEFLAGVPATVGGAAVMNAGAWGNQFGDLVERVDALDAHGHDVSLSRGEIAFGYRHSSLDGYVVYRVAVRLEEKERVRIDEETGAYMRQRLDKQDMTAASAGCVFRNPGKQSAGRLIESCGLKGAHVGGAYVSSKHANFIVNSASATAADVLKLMQLVRKTVKKASGITLEQEIKVWK